MLKSWCVNPQKNQPHICVDGSLLAYLSLNSDVLPSLIMKGKLNWSIKEAWMAYVKGILFN